MHQCTASVCHNRNDDFVERSPVPLFYVPVMYTSHAGNKESCLIENTVQWHVSPVYIVRRIGASSTIEKELTW
jgi:hypothetical protein